jgi:signal transduction histidine kinase
LKTEAKKNILLVCKEAVNNIAKYSQATRAVIQIDAKDGQLYLHITDNGTGFAPGTQKGNGLLNMKNRCEESGGSFEIISSREAGTAIHCFFPLTRISN